MAFKNFEFRRFWTTWCIRWAAALLHPDRTWLVRWPRDGCVYHFLLLLQMASIHIIGQRIRDVLARWSSVMILELRVQGVVPYSYNMIFRASMAYICEAWNHALGQPNRVCGMHVLLMPTVYNRQQYSLYRQNNIRSRVCGMGCVIVLVMLFLGITFSTTTVSSVAGSSKNRQQ